MPACDSGDNCAAKVASPTAMPSDPHRGQKAESLCSGSLTNALFIEPAPEKGRRDSSGETRMIENQTVWGGSAWGATPGTMCAREAGARLSDEPVRPPLLGRETFDPFN